MDIMKEFILTIDAAISVGLKRLIAVVDQYLYTLVLFIRYLWLLLLEITAPIAILALFFSDEDNNYSSIFQTWLRNLYSCYMMGAGFIIANFMGEALRKSIWKFYELDNVGILVLIIIVKITLYSSAKWASSKLI